MMLEEKTGLPVCVLNDVNAVVLGEQWNSGGADGETIFCITIGTGIGGSIMLDGIVYEGAHFRGCEIGYIDYDDKGGSFETLNSAKALLRQARSALNDEKLSEDEFFKRVERREKVETQVYMSWISGLARRIADIILITDPDRILIGGGITERGNLLLQPLKKAVRNCLPGDFQDITGIELASCGNKSGILGAVKNFINCTKEIS